ncbi:MAG TPA: YncE family protein [Candidatus Acidoferrales bacterium]|nr:YncE family protein [Candidatus Acidoferrales bacterium]
MKRIHGAVLLILVCAFAISTAVAQRKYDQQLPMVHMSGLMRLVETFPLPTEGYMDHLTADLKNQRLFLSGENNDTFLTIDMRAGKVIHETPLGGHPRKPFFDPKQNLVWVDLTDNTLVGIDGATFEVAKTVEFTGGKGAKRDPDNGAYDFNKGLYYSGVGAPGSNDGTIEIVDTNAAKLVGSIKMNGTEPAGIVLDPTGKRLYVGMGDVVDGKSMCKVIDTEKRQIISEWEITGGPQPHVGGLDPAHHRLFFGSRLQGGHRGEPGKLTVLDSDTGKLIQSLDSPGGADEIYYDAKSGRIYFQGTTGTIAVYKQNDADHYELLGKVPTGAIGKSGMWIPSMNKYYAAVPKHIVQTPPYPERDYITEEAHMMVFEILP